MRLMAVLTLVLKDLWTLSFLKDFLLEFLGTALFLSSSLSAVVLWPNGPISPDGQSVPPSSLACHSEPIRVALAFGLSVAVTTVCFGGRVQLNPAVTFALTLTLRLSPWRATLYVAGQLLGALAACALMLVTMPTELKGTLALNQVSAGVQLYQAFLIESMVSLQLVLVVLVTTQPKCPLQIFAPLLVGLSVTLGHLVAMGYTGCGMNPARSFGPAVVNLNFHHHWVYWAGPCLGAGLASLFNDLLLHPRWGCLGDYWAEFKELFPKDPIRQCVCVLLLLCTVRDSEGLNLQLENATVFSGPTGSLFGFSVDFHKLNDL
ncbi:lens fiber major intrinsic protein-like [Aplochiton taeniatus]